MSRPSQSGPEAAEPIGLQRVMRHVQHLVPDVAVRLTTSSSANARNPLDVLVLAPEQAPQLTCTIQLLRRLDVAVISFGGTGIMLSKQDTRDSQHLENITTAVLQGRVRLLCAVDATSARIVGSRVWGEWGEHTYMPDSQLEPQTRLVELTIGGP
jgi:hypothetical protein